MKKIEHIGIAVENMETSSLLFEKLLGVAAYQSEEIASEGVHTLFFKNGPTKIELLAATNPESPIAKFLTKKGEGIHHIAFEVMNIEQEMIRLKQEGFIFIDEIPRIGADNKRIVFLHPKNTNGILIELCQEIK
ncbi:methylmalonyl-CoA epimerase [Flavobacterium sp. 7A]|uniref:methylmalonyl-CoA epimerase n=1 Tax=Flavobacterium sp. 7A TaxID=2940571 RepID=UPI0022274BC4|nr:methylmalonyl-CoA epimerase [Flavobacterium sp. 7A]MCW2119138.1 methylmalonyl-CoA/ethylmalonyl-CoA epimerase [Flavobacterium sp. 7A]